MTFATEPLNASDDKAFAEGLNLRDTTAALLEVSIAALTTEPELQNIGRSLISLVRYHAKKANANPPIR